MILETMGGLGLFLLGMMLLTDGLKQLAGQAMKKLLARFVRGPFSGLTTGALFTALIQSSSATTLTTIGFVSAGLITFQQAVGVVFGANIGTTSTGWIVSLLGLKISLGAVSPPLILLGVLLRLFSRDRFAALGGALAGFALIFFGIGVMQTGMEDLAARIDPASIPGDGLTGRFLLVLIGVVMTVVMQSSSAAVAATLIAVDSGAIGFEQAAALVVGQNIGTTVTAAIASIGASTPAKRTALAHIAFN
ncbi:MAG: Na/Pi symporter, partial [Phycisphaerales bacterium]